MSDLTPTAHGIKTTEPVEATLETPKLSIKFDSKYKSITAFEWNEIPNFAVITGINGTGKSQLLELIYNTIINSPRSPEPAVFNGKNIGSQEVAFLNDDWRLDGTSILSVTHIKQSRQSYYKQFRETVNNSNLRENDPWLFETYQDVIKKLGKSPELISEDEFLAVFPGSLSMYFQVHRQLGEIINKIFFSYRLDLINLKDKGFSTAEIKEKLGEKPWDVLRKILKEAKLPFNINDPETYGLWDDFQLKLTDQFSNDEVNIDDLSSGERVLMSLVFYLYSSKERGVFPKLFLLDEPDAHLHPSMSQVFINVIKKVLVDELGIQVIMTTHSPSTVALTPEEAIFIASRKGQRIQKSSKDAALKLLTAGVPSFSIIYENRRQIFVESKYDVYFYERIYRKISDYLEPEVSLSFISSGEANIDKHGQPVSSCDQVINVTKVLREAGNKFVWGIIDWDTKNTESQFIKVLGNGSRYSIENYLFDPILVSALLLREKFVTRNELGLPNHATYIDFNNYDNTQLQNIANFVIDKVRAEVNPPNEVLESIRLINGRIINIPIWYLHHQGHDLENKILEAFPTLNRIKAGKEDALKNAIIDKVIDDLPELISDDFLDIFKKLQAV